MAIPGHAQGTGSISLRGIGGGDTPDAAASQACSGSCAIQAFTAATVLGLMGLLLWVGRPVCAVVVHIVRLVPSVLAYGHLRPGVADLIHDVSGWAVLGLAVVLLWGLLLLLRWFEVPIDPYPVERRESAR